MFQTFKQISHKRKAKVLKKDIIALKANWGDGGQQAKIMFSDNGTDIGSCIHCINPPCMEYTQEELNLSMLPEFPADRNNSVCPTNAISWPLRNDAPIIHPDSCISCGLCVSRCPVFAISMDSEGIANINDAENEYFQLHHSEVTKEIIQSALRRFAQVQSYGIILKESDLLLRRIFDRIHLLTSSLNSQFPNHLARNLLIGVGIGTAMRRRGDNNIRMDLVLGPPGVELGTGEVEFGSEVIEAPRNLLDNIAVLIARYNKERDTIIPIIVSLSLPNHRSEYWQVINDISKVLQIRLGSVTVGMLMIIVWNRQPVVIETGEELYADSTTYSLRKNIEKLLRRRLEVTVGYPGFIECQK
jgi:Fe-S-cluster-containing hydrogenase component 2